MPYFNAFSIYVVHLCPEQGVLKNDRPIVIMLAKYDAVNSVIEFGSEGKTFVYRPNFNVI